MKKLKEDGDSSTIRTVANSHKRHPCLAHVYVLHALHDEREARPHVGGDYGHVETLAQPHLISRFDAALCFELSRLHVKKITEEKTLEVFQRMVSLHENGSLGDGLQRGDIFKLLDKKRKDKRKLEKHGCVGFIAVVPVEKKCT